MEQSVDQLKRLLEETIQANYGLSPHLAHIIKKELGLHNVHDLLTYFPVRYEDRTQAIRLGDLGGKGGKSIYCQGILGAFDSRYTKGKPVLSNKLTDQTGTLNLFWFNQTQTIQRMLRPGATYWVYGKVDRRQGGGWSMVHPEMRLCLPTEQPKKQLDAIYRISSKINRLGIKQEDLRRWIAGALKKISPYLLDMLPADLIKKYRLCSVTKAYQWIHQPTDNRSVHQAHRRLKFEILFFFYFSRQKAQIEAGEKKSTQKLSSADLPGKWREKLWAQLGFDLTEAQKRVLKEIDSDLVRGYQMNRLVQGDVGSGKTVVALAAMLPLLEQGGQAVCLAPTMLLARQHAQKLTHYTASMGLKVALLTGKTGPAARDRLRRQAADGSLHILVGTHALLHEQLAYKKCALVIIDEQHRFGVAQKAQLWQKAPNGSYPHILIMSATPIPRTLAMAQYGQLARSIIDELPAGRKPIITIHRRDRNRLALFGFLKKQVAAGRQIYMVYPRIEGHANASYKDLYDGYHSMQRAFPKMVLGILHGDMADADKQYEMDRFHRGKTQILLSTTVIEVGIDVPNATVMVVEDADRFGLSTLHQLRGRIGRGTHQGYCILMTKNELDPKAKKRLDVLVETNDGFRIAEQDLILRGPGEMMGKAQSGQLSLQLIDWYADRVIVQCAQKEVTDLLTNDPHLKLPQHQVLIYYLKIYHAHLPTGSELIG